MRRASLFAATLLLVAVALGGAAPVVAAGSSPEQAAPTAGAPPASVPQQRELTLEQRADIFMARKNYADAADYYYRALKQSTFKDPLLWNKLGIAFQQESKLHSARQAYAKATHADPNFAEGWNNLGTVYFLEKKYGKSVGYYQRAIKLKSGIAAFHMNLGTSYYHQKKVDQAVEEYRTALAIDPKVAVQQSAMGTTINAGGADVEFYFCLAKALASIGSAEDAVRYLRRALEDGYSDMKRIDEDPDFKKISQYPGYIELMRNPPVAIKN
jgi:tetratricopeptide (TPR) repeat protein